MAFFKSSMKIPALVAALLLGAGGFLYASTTGQEMVVEGDISGLSNQKIYMKLYKEDRKPVDFLVADIVDGKFIFNGKVENPPAMVSFHFDDPSIRCRGQFLIDNSKIRMTSEAGVSVNKKWTHVKILEFSGSKSNETYQLFNDEIKGEFYNRRVEINNKIGDMNYDWETPKEQWSDEDQESYKALRAEYEQVDQDEIARLEKLSNEKSDELLGLMAFSSLSGKKSFSNESDLQKSIDGLGKEVRESQLGKYYFARIRAEIERKRLASEVTAGNSFKDFTQKDVDGKLVKASNLLKPGRLLFIDFWASWCGPCRAENPHVLAAYEKYHDKGFDVLAVSLDDSREAWLEAIEEDGMPWIHVSDLKGFENAAATMYGVNGIPSNYLLNEKGEIVATQLRGERLHDKLAELLD
ncbi:AhpC/TSA family protein [Porticoccaceae bacterium LTM1]|nr:AhpC/TSA family protein [Porticoccaceae bacterium LTM1]